jgi:hypothetical protein
MDDGACIMRRHFILEWVVPYADKEARNAKLRQKRKYDPVFRMRSNAQNLASQRRAFRDPNRWAKRAVIRLRHVAKLKNVPFNITHEDLPISHVCPVLGVPFVFGKGYRDHYGPSVDRIVPELGYVKGNVKVISLRANRLKHELTDSTDLRKVADYIDSLKGAGAP